ncbi:DUF885 domain-containing protein [Nevskia soli]|uniref:DUF885 domain-containing protein n=1 Tax=Nevskia soli TaxID=418856 RepID=UPI00068B8D7A|nr:DUF885 family protein [Nevskia soli]
MPFFPAAVLRFRAAPCLATALMALALIAGPAPASADDLNMLVADYERYSLQQDPVTAGQQGDQDALKRWPDDSQAADAIRKKALEGFRNRLDALGKTPLQGEDALNRAAMSRQVGRSYEGLSFDEARFPFAADDGFFNIPDYVARGTVIRTQADADSWLARLDALPAFYATEIANARRGLATDFVQPAPVVDAALRVAKAQSETPAAQSSLLLPFATLPDNFSAEQQKALRTKALQLVTDKIKPAQRELLEFLEKNYLPKARAKLGIEATPNGAAYYAFLVRRHTTTDITPDQMHELGLKEVARIRAEMNGVIAETGFHGSFKEFQADLRSNPKFYVSSRQALMEKASEIAKRIDDQLPKWFGLLPRLPYGVRPVPREIEESYTSARYWPGSPEQGTAGGYMVNTSHLDKRPLYEMPSLTLHEAVPGHHLQIALAQENKAIPLFRRNDDLTAYVEGWALYSEKLGIEMGIYRDPYENFGRLSMEMWRACRLVVDTGLHHKGWTREQAIAYMSDNTVLSDKNIEVEVDRYIGWPGQALGYKIGELKILELRHRAESALGDRFDIRKFHDLVLGEGPLPLDLLEERVNAWIARSKT